MHKLHVTLILLLTLSPLCLANMDDWELKRSTESIRVYQKPGPSGYAITRVDADLNSSMDSLLMLMRDRSTCPRWVHACREGQLTTQYSPERRLDYTVIDSPLWFADRDMYIYSTTKFEPKSRMLFIHLTGKENQDNGQVGKVRVRSLEGFWRFQQLERNKVRVTYQISSNPQLPASALLDAYMADSSFRTIENLSTISQEEPYKDRKLPELHE